MVVRCALQLRLCSVAWVPLVTTMYTCILKVSLVRPWVSLLCELSDFGLLEQALARHERPRACEERSKAARLGWLHDTKANWTRHRDVHARSLCSIWQKLTATTGGYGARCPKIEIARRKWSSEARQAKPHQGGFALPSPRFSPYRVVGPPLATVTASEKVLCGHALRAQRWSHSCRTLVRGKP